MLSAGPSQGHTCLPPMAGRPKCEELPLHIRVQRGCQGQIGDYPSAPAVRLKREKAGEQDSKERGVQLGPAAGAISKGGLHRFLGVKVDSSSRPHNVAPQARTPASRKGLSRIFSCAPSFWISCVSSLPETPNRARITLKEGSSITSVLPCSAMSSPHAMSPRWSITAKQRIPCRAMRAAFRIVYQNTFIIEGNCK